ncbi:MAG: hypothetical protein A2V67_18855 [Deltaproteobacteria bacterium RBG_13_61_14]|nr:MAG: hypothetical protein A2V67_18855 [Deltaproteobacteria bacterium RBG_13_61_14]
MKLRVLGVGVAGGVVLGLAIFVITLFIYFQGGGVHLSLLAAIYWGYKVSVMGAFTGLAYGFIDGFIAGVIFAVVYNLLAGKEATKAG